MSKNYYDCVDGIYVTRNVYRDRPLKYCRYGSCGVLETENDIFLQSYTTIVLRLNKKSGWLYCTGTYSATTRKHIGLWLKEFCPDVSYQMMKNCYANNMEYNINTGELKKHINKKSVYSEYYTEIAREALTDMANKLSQGDK